MMPRWTRSRSGLGRGDASDRRPRCRSRRRRAWSAVVQGHRRTTVAPHPPARAGSLLDRLEELGSSAMPCRTGVGRSGVDLVVSPPSAPFATRTRGDREDHLGQHLSVQRGEAEPSRGRCLRRRLTSSTPYAARHLGFFPLQRLARRDRSATSRARSPRRPDDRGPGTPSHHDQKPVLRQRRALRGGPLLGRDSEPSGPRESLQRRDDRPALREVDPPRSHRCCQHLDAARRSPRAGGRRGPRGAPASSRPRPSPRQCRPRTRPRPHCAQPRRTAATRAPRAGLDLAQGLRGRLACPRSSSTSAAHLRSESRRETSGWAEVEHRVQVVDRLGRPRTN